MAKPLFIRIPSTKEQTRLWTDPPSIPWQELREVRLEVRCRVTVPGGVGLGLSLKEWLGLLIGPDVTVPDGMPAEAAHTLAATIQADLRRAWTDGVFVFRGCSTNARRHQPGKPAKKGTIGTIYLERLGERAAALARRDDRTGHTGRGKT